MIDPELKASLVSQVKLSIESAQDAAVGGAVESAFDTGFQSGVQMGGNSDPSKIYSQADMDSAKETLKAAAIVKAQEKASAYDANTMNTSDLLAMLAEGLGSL